MSLPSREGPADLHLTASLWEQMVAEVDYCAPEEACGLLAGLGNRILRVLPVPNELRSPVRYRMSPADQWRAFQEIEESGWELLAIYHSHPRGPDFPSPTDIAEAYYPDAAYLIWSRGTGSWMCRAFRIQGDQIQNIPIQISNSEQPF